MEIPFRLTDWQSDRTLAFQSTGGPIPMQGSYAFEPSGDGTQVTFLLTGEPGGFFKLAEPVLMQILQRQWQTNLANLKDAKRNLMRFSEEMESRTGAAAMIGELP
jgi:hypothetical protein